MKRSLLHHHVFSSSYNVHGKSRELLPPAYMLSSSSNNNAASSSANNSNRRRSSISCLQELVVSLQSLPNSSSVVAATTTTTTTSRTMPSVELRKSDLSLDTPSSLLLSAISEKNISQLSFGNIHEDRKDESVEEDKRRRVARWATGLAKLLQDEQGVEIFQDFLISEFSAENLHFWLAVEEYKQLDEVDADTRRHVACSIFSRFLDPNGDEAVNVDASTRNAVKTALASVEEEDAEASGGPSSFLFQIAQDHVFQLLRLDSYSRFLKSSLYKQCLLREMSNKSLSNSLTTNKYLSTASTASTASANEDDKRKRVSGAGGRFFPWMKTKGSKRFGRVSTPTSSSAVFSFEGRLDTASSGLCRVTFPDESTAVLNPKHMSSGDTVGHVLEGLCLRRGFSLASVEAVDGTDTAAASAPSVDLDSAASSLVGREVRLEPRILFRVELMPSQTCVGVRARPGRTLGNVLKPVLERYGLRPESLQLHLSCETTSLLDAHSAPPAHSTTQPHLSLDMDVKHVEGSKLQLFFNNQNARSTSATAESLHKKNELWNTDDVLHQRLRHSNRFVANSLLDTQQRKTKKNRLVNAVNALMPVMTSENNDSVEDVDSFANLSQGPRDMLDLLDKISDTRLNDQRGKITDTYLDLPDFLKEKENKPRDITIDAHQQDQIVGKSMCAAMSMSPKAARSATPKVEAGKLLPRHLILNSMLDQQQSSEAAADDVAQDEMRPFL